MSYKYHCRPCPQATRDRCIQECNQSPSVRLMMLRAFEVGTDTQEMWGRLHMNCLRLIQEQHVPAPPRSSLLGRRLKGEPTAAPIEKQAPPPPPPPPAPRTPDPIREPLRKPARPRVGTGERRIAKTTPLRYCLALQTGRHRIALPVDGEIVLGRFDPIVNITPDVDLSYDDRENHTVSRRHAIIAGFDGRHAIEDLGSTNGTWVNGIKLGIGQKVRLQPSDKVSLGYCEFVYQPLAIIKTSPINVSPQAYLWVTFNGQRFPLPTWGELIIGRGDLAIGGAPDIDLSQIEDAAQVVARRHAKIVARSSQHYLEELGSASGTKINGVRVEIGKQHLLSPGDHIWLGGCVLAYDIEQKSDKRGSG